MPKKLKLNLNQLKVQSFVTALNDFEKKQIYGGKTFFPECNTEPPQCSINASCGGTCDASICATIPCGATPACCN